MKDHAKFTCLFAASFLAITPYTPQQFLILAKERISVSEKIAILKRLSASFPLDRSAKVGRKNLVDLLISDNRCEEALQLYRKYNPGKEGARQAPGNQDRPIDFKFLEMLLRTGRYNEVLRVTSPPLGGRMWPSGQARDFSLDMRLLELRVQAFLAKGQFQFARECVDRWLDQYERDGVPGGRFEGDVRSAQFLRRHLQALERSNGPEGKAIFTASVPDSLQHWSHRQDVPIVFFKLIPAHPGGQLHEPLLPGRHEGDSYFQQRVNDLNRGFRYVSGGQFGLRFAGLHTLYVKEGDIDPASSGGDLVTSRVYVHTIPQLYRLSGDAFVILLDYRRQADGEAAYMGDGLIHLSASKLETLVVMHEILHGLGATHQEWNMLEAEGYKFDPADRGLMTFDRGEILDLGLEEKNRALLGWPRVGVVRPHFATDTEIAESAPSVGQPVPLSPAATALLPARPPGSPELPPSL